MFVKNIFIDILKVFFIILFLICFYFILFLNNPQIQNETSHKSFILVLSSLSLLNFKNLYEKISEKIPDDDDKELLQELIDILEKDGPEKISENLDKRLEKFTQGI